MRLTWGDSEPDSVSLNFSLRGLFVLKISGKFSDRFKFTFLIHYFKENFWSSSFGFLIHRSSLKNIWPKVDQKWNINTLSCFVIETSWIKTGFFSEFDTVRIKIIKWYESYHMTHISSITFLKKSLNRARVWISFSIDSGADLKWFDSDHCLGGSHWELLRLQFQMKKLTERTLSCKKVKFGKNMTHFYDSSPGQR